MWKIKGSNICIIGIPEEGNDTKQKLSDSLIEENFSETKTVTHTDLKNVLSPARQLQRFINTEISCGHVNGPEA